MHARRIGIGFLALGALLLGLIRVTWLMRPLEAQLAAESSARKELKQPVIKSHPLDPLTKEELNAAVSILRKDGRLPKHALFPLISLQEPSRQELAIEMKPIPRRAFLVALDREANRTFEAVVNLLDRNILSWKELRDVQPAVLIEEFDSAGDIVRVDPRWRKAMAKRKIDPDEVQLDTWAAGPMEVPGHKGARLLRVLSYHRGKKDDQPRNAYARPIEGVVALVNMNTRKVIELIDRPGITPENASNFFDPKVAAENPKGLNRVEVTQPGGPSFRIQGHEVRWQNWVFRYSFHPREGVVLHTIGWQEGGKIRPILHRASIAEMVVPYGDPDVTWTWRNAFDMGEYGLGQSSTPLRKGQEVPGNAVLLPITLAKDNGEVEVKKDILAFYEQDAGILWTHTDYKTGRTVTHRGQKLVLQNLFTIGNYDYGVQWIFHQDGVLEAQVELTGVMLAKGVKRENCKLCEQKPDHDGKLVPRGDERFGKLVGKNVLAPYHQHFFCFRLEMNVDGTKNSVYEMNVRPHAEHAELLKHNGFFVEYQLLRTEQEARRQLDVRSHRSWKVVNPSRKSALGHFPAYKLEPGPSATAYLHPDSVLRKRAGFLESPLWVTRSRPGELYPAGFYPNQHPGGDGLPRWASENESIQNEHLTMWYTLGVTHVPRVEEWPVMPVSRAGFRLAPDGFFDRNPTVEDQPD